MNPTHRPQVSLGNATLITTVIVMTMLYFARDVLIPVAVAVLFTFLLAPLVIRFRHWHFGKYPSVLATVILFALGLALVGWLVTAQLVDLAYRLPQYQQNIHTKLKSVSVPQDGMVTRFSKFFQDLSKDLSVDASTNSTDRTSPVAEPKPVQVEIHQPIYSWRTMGAVMGSLINPLIKTGMVMVLIIFMLLQREDMRDRLIRLIGAGHLNRTTSALDDAAHRVSRYLLMQLLLNSGYGIAIGIGLFFMGVPNPVLWGVMAALLRFVPYLGIWIAALMPAAIALAIEPGWVKTISVVVLFFAVDILALNFLEPLLYGASTGISPLAILLAAVFWTWLWGPIGLLLSTPLTVCLAVLGRYVPDFGFLGIMLTDKQVLSSETRFYQRLLAMDLEEATEIAETFAKDHSLEELFDELIVPALILVEEDRQRGVLDNSRQKYIFENMAWLIEDLAERFEEIKSGVVSENKAETSPPTEAPKENSTVSASASTFVIPSRDEADELAGQMLCALMRRRGVVIESLPPGDLVNSHVERVTAEKVSVVCVSAMPTRAAMHARNICKRLRVQAPDLKIILGLWRENDLQKQNRLSSALNCTVVTNLRQAVEQLLPLISANPQEAGEATSLSASTRKAA